MEEETKQEIKLAMISDHYCHNCQMATILDGAKRCVAKVLAWRGK